MLLALFGLGGESKAKISVFAFLRPLKTIQDLRIIESQNEFFHKVSISGFYSIDKFLKMSEGSSK